MSNLKSYLNELKNTVNMQDKQCNNRMDKIVLNLTLDDIGNTINRIQNRTDLQKVHLVILGQIIAQYTIIREKNKL